MEARLRSSPPPAWSLIAFRQLGLCCSLPPFGFFDCSSREFLDGVFRRFVPLTYCKGPYTRGMNSFLKDLEVIGTVHTSRDCSLSGKVTLFSLLCQNVQSSQLLEQFLQIL